MSAKGNTVAEASTISLESSFQISGFGFWWGSGLSEVCSTLSA